MKKRKIFKYNPALKTFAKELRNNSTKSEIILWKELKKKQMRGYDFHRQKPLDNFIADFFCHELMLVIELDGITHQWDETIIKDRLKEEKLKLLGLHILRFQDDDVLKRTRQVLLNISDYIDWYEGEHSCN